MMSEEKPKKKRAIPDADIYDDPSFELDDINSTILTLQEELKLSVQLKRARDRTRAITSFYLTEEVNNDRVYKAYFELGTAYLRLFQFDKAEVCYRRHLEIACDKRYVDKKQQVVALTNIGCVLKRILEYEESLQTFKQALDIAEEIGDLKGQSRILNNMGTVYEAVWDLDSAIESYLHRAEIADNIRDTEAQIKSYACLGSMYHLKGELRDSIMYFEKVVINLRMKLVKQQTDQMKENEATEETKVEEEVVEDPSFYDEGVVTEKKKGFLFGLFG